MDHRRNRRQMKIDQEQHYDEMESHKAPDNAVQTRLAEAEKRAEQAEKELTATQLALCEVYELLGQMQALLKPGEVDSNA